MEVISGNQIKKKWFCINVTADLLNFINFIIGSKTMCNHMPLIATTEIKTQEYTTLKRRKYWNTGIQMVIQNNKMDDTVNTLDIVAKKAGANAKQQKRQGQRDRY